MNCPFCNSDTQQNNVGRRSTQCRDCGQVFSLDQARLLDLPDIRQRDHYSCGAAASMSVGKYFGVGPATLEQWKKALGTDVQESTRPSAIVQYLSSLGLIVSAQQNCNIEDLQNAWSKNTPVITPVQDYRSYVPGNAKFAYGHYLTVIGVALGHIFCQDSSEDNVTKGSGTIADKGRVMIDFLTWMKNWHDKDVSNNKYIQYGIFVSAP